MRSLIVTSTASNPAQDRNPRTHAGGDERGSGIFIGVERKHAMKPRILGIAQRLEFRFGTGFVVP
jgi:hypothetical protein